MSSCWCRCGSRGPGSCHEQSSECTKRLFLSVGLSVSSCLVTILFNTTSADRAERCCWGRAADNAGRTFLFFVLCCRVLTLWQLTVTRTSRSAWTLSGTSS
jgi:hypothetical protein